MRIMWCWRCKMELPMLDEKEFEIVHAYYHAGIRGVKDYREKYGLPLSEISVDDFYVNMRQKYKELTNFEESNYLAILHHRISMYGDDCKECGKPWRTPKAAFCAACGNREK